MPPTLGLFLTIAFVFFLFRRDLREKRNVTGALWLPLLWMLIGGSRPVTEWLNLLHFPITFRSVEEGSPLDAFIYMALIAAGIYVLRQRQISLGEIFRNNGWLMAFLLYCFVAIVWSDFPFIAFKRWIKILGLPVMALIVLTEPDFEEALARLMKRTAYVLVPFSILAIKYYPEIGRRWDEAGLASNVGVSGGKNMLGAVSMVLGLFFFWHLLKTWRSERGAARRNELALIGGFAFLIGWLLKNAHSATSLACLPVGIVVMVLVGRRWVNKRLIGMYVLAAVIVLLSAELMFNISAYAIELLGRDATLTDRTILWEDLLKQKTNPIFGVGFESFWLGADRLAQLHEGRSWQPNEAHNGYLEIYLDLGMVGLFILVGLLIATFRRICRGLLTNFHFGRFRLGLFAAVVLNNWTEVTFRGPHPIWLLFYIIAMEYPKLPFASVEPAFGATTSDEEMELVHSPDEFGIDSSLGDSRSAISARDI